MNTMELIVKKISDLNVAKYNPRIELEPHMEEYQKLKNSLQTFGLVNPIIWNKRTNTVVGGHQRLKIWKALGHDDILVSVVDLNLEQEKQLNLALNKVEGIWDEEKLAKLLEELTVDDLELAGYSEEELELLLNDINSYIDEDLLEKETNSEPKTFNITLVFSLDNKDSVEKYIKGFEKNNVVQEMIDFIEKRKEDM